MSQDRSEVTEQVVKFPPKQQSSSPADEAGQAVITQIQKAAQLANENCDRAMALAHKLAMQLRAAEDRITQLEAEVALFRDRATRAEGWLQTIHSEIEQKLIAPRPAFRTEQTLVSSDPNTEPSQPPAA
jgi:chromosome segregation ATPase